MDVYHTQVGALLAATWTLPPEVCESLGRVDEFIIQG
jgi:HD-like signal output (HDOD) protein